MASTYELSRTRKMCVGIDKLFNIYIRLGDDLHLRLDTFNILTQKCRNIFDIKYSAHTGVIPCNNLTVNPEFNSRSRMFPATISIVSKIDNKQCTLDRGAFLRLVELSPTVNFKIKVLMELSPYAVLSTMKCAYIKSEYFCKEGGIKIFIENYLNNIPMLHAHYLSELLVYFPIQMYHSLANANK